MARRAKPWFRAALNAWYATIDGNEVSLGIYGRENEAATWLAWQQLRNGNSPLTVRPVSPVAAAQLVSVGEVIRDFLRDAAGRVDGDTLELYRLFLTPFAKLHGRLPAASLTCPVAEQYSDTTGIPSWTPQAEHQAKRPGPPGNHDTARTPNCGPGPLQRLVRPAPLMLRPMLHHCAARHRVPEHVA